MSVTPSGEVYFMAYLENGSVEFGGETIAADATHSAFFGKLSASGEDLWFKTLPSPSPFGVTADDDVVLTYPFTGTIDLGGGPLTSNGASTAIVAYASDGSHRWSKVVSGPVYISRMAQAPGGELVFQATAGASSTYDGAPLTTGAAKLFFAVDSSDGTALWERPYVVSASSNFNPDQFAISPTGEILVAGSYNGALDLGGGVLPTGNDGVFLARYDADGNHIQSRRFCNLSCSTQGFLPGPNGELYFSGQTIGVVSIGPYTLSYPSSFVARLDEQDDVVWLKSFSKSGDSYISAPELSLKADGNIAFAHGYHGTAAWPFGSLTGIGEGDLAAGAFDPDGNLLWVRTFGAPNALLQYGITFFAGQPGGETTLALKLFQGAVDFGSGVVATSGSADIVVVRLAP